MYMYVYVYVYIYIYIYIHNLFAQYAKICTRESAAYLSAEVDFLSAPSNFLAQ